MLDPRIEYNAEKIEKLKKALVLLAKYVDSIGWRVTSGEDREHLRILEEIREILSESASRGKKP